MLNSRFKAQGENSGCKDKPVQPLQKELAFEMGKVNLSAFFCPDQPGGSSGLFFLSIILGKCVYLHKTHLKNVINIQFAQ